MVEKALQRTNMVESQVRPSDVADRRIIRAMLEVPRENFVAPGQQDVAYMDRSVPLLPAAAGQPARAMMAPRTLAKLIQLADIDAGARVLIIGAARGYSAAVLSRISPHIVALEENPTLAAAARDALAPLAAGGVSVVQASHAAGQADKGPYDAIVIEGAVARVPDALLDQLKDGGRLVAILSEGRASRAVVWKRLGGDFDRTDGFDATAPTVPGFEAAAGFVF